MRPARVARAQQIGFDTKITAPQALEVRMSTTWNEQTLARHLMELPLDLLAENIAIDETITPETLIAVTPGRKTKSIETDETILPGAQSSSEGELQPGRSLQLPVFSVGDAEKGVTPPESDSRLDLKLESVIGAGGMGQVFAAEQCVLRRRVAVKMLHPTKQSESRKDALLDEALVMGQLEHPNIIPVYTLGQTASQQPMLVMRRVSGVSWRTLIQDPEHPFWHEQGRADDRVGAHLDVLMRLCDAVEYAHAHGIIHRDIKPENVMLGDYGEVYLLDWGIALPRDVSARPVPCTLLGTPAYMAPEMAATDEARIGPWTDVYLLGASLYEALEGRPRHACGSLFAVLQSALLSEPATFTVDVSEELAQIVNTATSAAIEDRYQSARALRVALSSYLKHRSSLEIAATASERLRDLSALIEDALAPPSADEVYRGELQTCFTECHFGFLLALREWPQNKKARDGLQRSLEAMIDMELARRDADAARRLFAQLPSPRPALLEQIDALATLKAHEREQQRAMQQMHQDLDLRLGSVERTRFFVILCSFGLIFSIFIWFGVRDVGTVTHLQALTFSLITLGSFCFGFVLWRRRITRTLINRRLFLMVFLALSTLVTNRLMCIALDIPVPSMLTLDLFAVGVSIMSGSINIHRLFFVVTVIFMIGAVGMALWPWWFFELFNITLMLGIAASIGIFRLLPQGPSVDVSKADLSKK